MKVFAIILSALTLAFVASNVIKTPAKNDTLLEESKIVGGIEIDISYASSQAAVLEKGKLVCSGSIIKFNVLLTVAHCIDKSNIPELKIRSASNFHDKNGRVVAVLRVAIHHYYTRDHGFYYFDMALLFLKESAIDTGISAAIICLWDTDTVFAPGTYGTLAGWGGTEEGGPPSPVLRRVALPILPRSNCAARFGQILAAFSICTGFKKGGRDGCKGDSGAGLVVGTKLAGIFSYGVGCGLEKTPSGFTSVPALRAWIRQQAGV